MGCCGDPVGQPQPINTRVPQVNATVTQQPVPHPGAFVEKQVPPIAPTPQPTWAPNGFQPSPSMSQVNFTGVPQNLQSPPTTYQGSTGYSAMSSPPLVHPSAIRAGSQRTDTTTPHMSMMSPQLMTQPTTQASADEGKMSISIDFGTTFSGVAYGSSRVNGGRVQQILHWPGSFETFRKVPTCLLYDSNGQVLAWGLEAKNAGPMPGTARCEWFKLFLEPHALRDESAIDPRLPQIPYGKTAVDLIVDFLSCLWEYAKGEITREMGAVADLNSADVWLTVPAAWDAKGCDIMRECAIKAGLVASSHAGDRDWRNRLRIITEPEAAAVHCAYLTDLHKLKPSQNFMICDAGGGTVDLAVYKIIGELANLEIAEMCARSGANCGSLFLDLRFQELVRALLEDHPAHLDPASLAYFRHSFSETDKLAYMGEIDDDKMFNFTCFNVDDPHDPSVGLINGELAVPGALLRREVFAPVVSQVLDLIEEQTKKINQRIDALLLVGGFAGCEYLFQKVKEQFGSRIKVFARPDDADTATARGAAQYGLARRPLVSSVIAPRSYLIKVKLPVEAEDRIKRPAYITYSEAGYEICENRLQYLVQKGAIVRKGQRITTTFCKFSHSPQDSVFVAILYTSDADKSMRYTDEGEIMELCKWTVDIGSLPSFKQNASIPQPRGFYTEFELGLELDSAEVRGVLLYRGTVWGSVVFDFLV